MTKALARRLLKVGALACLGCLMCITSAQAHLMLAQKGTLNIVGDAVFMVMSLPVSAFTDVDDDDDGALSNKELDQHQGLLRLQIRTGLALTLSNEHLPLQLLMVDVAAHDQTPLAPAKQLLVLGRFQLPNTNLADDLRFQFRLFGRQADEHMQDVTVTRQAESQWLRFTPENASQTLLPGASALLWDYLKTGAVHVLSGPDHMLFLLVVLSAAWQWRAMAAALTCFTLGHAVTLGLSVLTGWSLSPSILEPAIAATIVFMAWFDAWSRRRSPPWPVTLRLVLVFSCALVHGLGLAEALADLTQWPAGDASLSWALGGFNLGVELAQLGVAALAWGLVQAWRRWGRSRICPVHRFIKVSG